ncbi:helix-turn-helix domain-containing protein [Cellulomonas sp. PhB143]|uniref:helix-turn-helix domain-containing protein n=1 Tax=Cellulomonas sp. PhB143 TaxID=2485186 RepID=UPI000F48BE4F|nr:helix-turn-helix transcriptional regulator [Cellulomonas sp. PhB143]ROS75512.1 helix-turn-helix protein [Cellulomonas sp. PhB143]
MWTSARGEDRQEPLWRHLLGERLRSLRHQRGETLDDVAIRAGVSAQYLSEIERGKKDPSSEMIAAVAGALDVTLLDLTQSVAEGLCPTPSSASRRSAYQATNFALAA